MVRKEREAQRPYMRTPISIGALIGNVGCWGLILDAPPSTPWPSRVFVLVFLALVTLFAWSYREIYFEDRVVARYLPYFSREVRWKDVYGFSLHPILRLRTPQLILSLPGTSPLLQTFIHNRLRAIPTGGLQAWFTRCVAITLRIFLGADVPRLRCCNCTVLIWMAAAQMVGFDGSGSPFL